MAKREVVVLAISFRPPEFNRDLCAKESLNFFVLSDTDRSVIKRYGVYDAQNDCARRITFLIDKNGFIRRIVRQVNPATHGRDLAELVRRWQLGESIYRDLCARCHGADGNATDLYPNTKPLGGIGNRMSDDEIVKATLASGFVHEMVLRKDEWQALAVFVSGLPLLTGDKHGARP